MKKILVCLVLAGLLAAGAARAADDLSHALGLYYRGDYAAAVAALQEMIREEPENAAAYYYLGYTYQEMGNYPAAREAFRRTYEIDPEFLPHVPGSP